MRKRPIGNALEYLNRVFEGSSWTATGGNWANALEVRFKTLYGTNYAVALNSGTSALHAALEAVGVRAGDEVISPGLTVIMDTFAILHAGAVPVYADVDPDTFNVTAESIEKVITEKTKAVIVVSLYGLAPNLPKIARMLKSRGIALIEDNCQSMLNICEGKLVGTYGDVACYSFEDSKIVSCGEGGMLITNNEEYAQKARKLAGIGFKNLTAGEGRVKLDADLFQNPGYERHDVLGWNYRMSEINAAFVMAQMDMVTDLICQRQTVAKAFIGALDSQNSEILAPQYTPAGYSHNYWSLACLYTPKRATWEEFRKGYIRNGGDGIYGAWMVPYKEPVIRQRNVLLRCPWITKIIDSYANSCPVAEAIQPRVMQFKTNYFDGVEVEQKLKAFRKTVSSLS